MIWGIDIPRYQAGIDLHRAKREGIDFAIIKASQGTRVDPQFRRHLDQARAAGLLHAVYHYQEGDIGAAAQAEHIMRTVPREVGVILDVEAGGGNAALARDITHRLNAAGWRTPLLYLPEWYRRQIGRPDLRGLPPLWYSRYPNSRAGAPADVYARNRGWLDGLWGGYGGLPVAVLQYSDEGRVAGRSPVDCNAFRGSRDELAALLGGGSPTFAAQEVDDLQPDERAALFSIQNELLGPRGPQGQIQGWPTALGRRTVVAMLVEMFNTWQPARRPPGVDHDVWPIDLLADGNAATFRNEGKLGSIEQRLAALDATANKLAELLATDHDLDPEGIKAAVHDAVATALQQNTVTVEVHGRTPADPANADAGAVVVGEVRDQMPTEGAS
ncbi:glycoside hydrolase family 25 protein [Saccharopolyspora phatthalungensis]|uniref:Lysozyme n=1 Tax=Saccharopolyspora phatthalungensis TaxID=664693 RepID=A0A840Q568_9PSEU|nr:glycoside hydrolase family 25 protein [Saccharopolyspora phatthalungensis]MBB5157652.1 hypothetical protein [Saccharopolyspora phatthalungensis]